MSSDETNYLYGALVLLVLFGLYSYNKYKKSLAQLNAQLADKTAEVATDLAQIAALNKQIVDLQAQIASVNTQLSSSNSQLASANLSITALNQNLATANASLKTRATELLNLRVQTCQALNSEAAGYNYDQATCMMDRNITNSLALIDSSTDTLIASILAYHKSRNTNLIPSDILATYLNVLKSIFDKYDYKFEHVLRDLTKDLKSMSFNQFKFVCAGLGMVKPPTGDQLKDTLFGEVVNVPGGCSTMYSYNGGTPTPITECYPGYQYTTRGLLSPLEIQRDSDEAVNILKLVDNMIATCASIMLNACTNAKSSEDVSRYVTVILTKLRDEYRHWKNVSLLNGYNSYIAFRSIPPAMM